MRRIIKLAIFAVVCVTVLLIIATAVARAVVNTGVYTNWFEKAASNAVGLEILINGRPEISFFPRLSVRAYGARLRNDGEDIIVAKEAEITPQIISLSKMTLRVGGITLRDPVFYVRRLPGGRFNFEKYSTTVSTLPVVNIDRISVFRGTLNYSDIPSSGGFTAEGLNIEARNLSVTTGRSDEFLKHFSFIARSTSKLLTLNGLVFLDIKFKCACKNGVFTFDPATLGIFGGKCSGSIVVDPTVPVAFYTADFTLSNFRIEDYLKTFYPNIAVAGPADYTAKLSLRGNTWDDMMRNTQGEMVLSGENFKLLGGTGSGEIVEDISGHVHSYSVACSLSNLRIEKYLKAFLHYRVPYGPMNITAKLSLSGDTADELKRSAQGEVTLKGDKLTFFGGKCSGKIVAHISGRMHRYFLIFRLTNFRIEQYLKTFLPGQIAKGPMNFTANLYLQGDTADELKRSAKGYVSLSGDNLQLFGSDLDRQFERFESSQNFNLFDAGAYFFVGPLGLLATKGYNFANVLKSSGGTSNIGRLFSSWKIDGGTALAGDVAMATKKYRVVLNGKIDFTRERFDDITLAIVNSKGCAIVKQKITGTFKKPVAEKPVFLVALAGPALNLFKKGRDLFSGGDREVFYKGSVPAPK